MTARIVAEDRDFFVAHWHRTVFSVYRGVCTAPHVASITAACNALLEKYHESVTYLGVIERGSPAPTEPVRRVLATWSRDVITKMAVAVIVPEGGGFRSAMVRGVGVALTVLAPHNVPFKFAGSVAEGAQLLAHFLPASAGGAEQLVAAATEARARWARHS